MSPSLGTTKRTTPVPSPRVRWRLGGRRNPPRIRRLRYEWLEDRRLLADTCYYTDNQEVKAKGMKSKEVSDTPALMRSLGIVDPSDFIDDNRQYDANPGVHNGSFEGGTRAVRPDHSQTWDSVGKAADIRTQNVNAYIGHPSPTSRVPSIVAKSSLQNVAYLDHDSDLGLGDGLESLTRFAPSGNIT